MESGNQKSRTSRLLMLNYRFDASNEVDETLVSHYNFLMENMNNLSEKEAHDWLMQRSKDPKFVEVTSAGFLYGILVDPQNAPKHFRNMGVSITDNWYTALYRMNMILLELFNKMRSEPKMQILYFFREAIKSNMPKIDNVLLNLLRTINEGGKLSEIYPFVHGVADFLNENREWIRSIKQGSLVSPLVLLSFSRFLHDYTQSGLNNEPFKKSLESACEFFLRERLVDMLPLGRDLVLILMRLGRNPTFAPFWKNLLYGQLQGLGGLIDLMNKPCQAVIFTFRLSLHITRKIEFLLKMKMPNFGRHLDWFTKQHLNGPEGGSIRAEIIRYLWYIGLSTPDFQQQHVAENRASLLSFFIRTAQPGMEMQWCKLVLIWDWFGFDSNIPNAAALVEPAFSLVRYLLTTNQILANSIIDFLIRSTTMISPNYTQFFITSVTNSFKQLSTIMPIMSVLESTRIDKPLRDMLRETFPELFAPKHPPMAPPPSQQQPPPGPSRLTPLMIEEEEKSVIKKLNQNSAAILPNEEEAKEKKKERKKLKKTTSLSEQTPETKRENILDVGSIETVLPLVRDELKNSVGELNSAVKAKSDEAPEAMQRLLMCIFENEELLENDQIEILAECLLIIYREYLGKREFFPKNSRSEDISDTFDMSFFALFRNLVLSPDGDESRKLLLMIIGEMRERCNCIGYLLLFFIKGTKMESEEAASAYTGLCKAMAAPLEDQLLEDLKQCVIDDHRLFAFLVPFIFERLSEVSGSVNLMRLICGSIDAAQALSIVREMCLENLTMFQKDTITPILNASIQQWDTIEQIMLWTFIRGFVKFDWLLNLIPRLAYNKHPEAITNLLLMIKQAEPSLKLMQNLLSRPANDFFTICAIKVLIDDNDSLEQVANHMATIIKRLIQSGEIYPPSPTKEKSSLKKTLCLEFVLSHLDTFRLNCLTKESRRAELFLSNNVLQEALSLAKKSERIADLRTKFTELFAVMEIFSDAFDTKQRPLRKTRQTKPEVEYSDERIKRRRIKEFEESDED
uniref:SOSS complex subunit A homolog n=1 Tax=Acrobeloides nanus TaxID=290746 RepID=A0A914CAV4_9BILA